MYKQMRPFDIAKGGNKYGLCLQNVRLGFNIPVVKYHTAEEAWHNTKQHVDRNLPAMVAVPLFYKFGNDGHVNVRLSNGEVWSDGTIYASLDDYLAKHPLVTYRGWGESVNDVAVLAYAPDEKPQSYDMPPTGSRIKLDPGVSPRTTFNSNGEKVGQININDDTYIYVVRGVHGNRVVINSASGGGNGVELALYYLTGEKIPGWKKV